MELKEIAIHLLPYEVIKKIRERILKKNKYIFVENINNNYNEPNQTRVLFSYVHDFLFENIDRTLLNTRNLESSIMLFEFISRGYCIDLIDCRDDLNIYKLNNKEYNINFGFGYGFRYIKENRKSVKNIMYLTEKYPEFSFKKEKERLIYFNERHKKKAKITRSNQYYKIDDFSLLNSIVFVGSENDSSFIPLNIPKYAIFPTGLKNKKYDSQKRIVEKSKRNFLWFGSQGAIHKGLDLLIDVFKQQKDLNLYIAGLNSLDKKILPSFNNTANIKDLGFINVKSDFFLEVIYECSFVILPSSSEGANTGVITCMNHGLIPVITREVGFDFKDFGYILEGFKIEYIKDVVSYLSKQSNNKLEKQHRDVLDYAMKHFSIENFKQTFSTILDKL